MSASEDSDSVCDREKDCDDDDEVDYIPKKKLPRLGDDDDNEYGSRTVNKQIESKKSTSSSKKSFGQKMLEKHGHQAGKGLGKYLNGIVEPVKASNQKGTRGLGFVSSQSLKDACKKYDPNLNVINIKEKFEWLINNYPDTLDINLLESWVTVKSQLRSLENECTFCESSIVKGVLSAKEVLNELDKNEKLNSRSRSNPFESIGKAIFLNRAAMKMANLDAILNRMFTEPKNEKGENLIDHNNLLYFADVCAGPGGFSEYIFFRKKWRAKGFGFTLKGENDFALDKFCAGTPETFEAHYGEREDGDIYIPENIESFKKLVMKYTDDKGVHFMMADGGIPLDEKNNQEIMCHKLYLCQCLVALLIVRTGGHFVVKLFDIFTSFSVGLVYLMYRSFKEISIIKPNTSRPANSERYLVCKFKREDCEDIACHLFSINKRFPIPESNSYKDVYELVPVEILKRDEEFFNYVKTSNESFGKLQIQSLIKFAAYAEETDRKDENQAELKIECLKLWDIPEEAWKSEYIKKNNDPVTICHELLGTSVLHNFKSGVETDILYSYQFKKQVVSIHDWYFVTLNGDRDQNTCGFYLGLGRNKIYKYTNKGWDKIGNASKDMVFPAKTLVYGEIVNELFGERRGQTKRSAFHIIDGLFLGGVNIRNLPLKERQLQCEIFAKSLSKEVFTVRTKRHNHLTDFPDVRRQLVLKDVKSSSKRVCISIFDKYFHICGGVMFLRDTRDPWHRYFSSKWETEYYCNLDKRKSDYKAPLEAFADFDYTFNERLTWWWDSDVSVLNNANQISQEFNHENKLNSTKMQAQELCDYINDKLTIKK